MTRLTRSIRGAPQVWTLFIVCMVLTSRAARVTPPFQNPDEGAHYLRALEVGRLHFINRPGDVGVPVRCDEYLTAAHTYGPVAYYQPEAETDRERADCQVTSRNTAGAYPPVPYILSATALRVPLPALATVERRLRLARLLNG